ncbi:uncharacterized protein N7477_005154 [Penicillium maclennaniae]|uniref:uncharacterized protein n=1 Tax=Penicillium maclennaniae TaxID=1343394 RepID=UPI00254118A5|nr:uncharacterized protein N7477_005154 [Penicillium maclennaniae]KAJ5675220.1 hypothetical protein N7477_005154 [Penicillium maclennaniae]
MLSERFRKQQDGRPTPSRRRSDPEEEARKGSLQYSDRRDPQPGKYGPAFQQGPRQEEIFDRKASGERVSEHDLHGRNHSVHIIPKHQLPDPYEKVPPIYTAQMKSDHNRYKDLSERPKVPVRGDQAPTNEQGRFIKDREADARGGRIAANTAAQARSGISHKYLQAYENKAAIITHHTQVHAKLTQADSYRKSEQDLDKRHHAWAQKMD